MITVVSWENRNEYIDLIEASFALRYEIFHKRLGWEVETYNGLEFDDFDASPGTSYLIHTDKSGTVTGCARLLPTTGPNMLRDVFPVLLDGEKPPFSPRVWESTRFAVSTDGQTNASHGMITHKLLDAMCELGMAYGLQKIVSVTDPLVERVLKRSGLPTERLGSVHQFGVAKAVAGQFTPCQDTLEQLRTRSGLKHSQIIASPWTEKRVAA